MPDIFATVDGYLAMFNQSSWANARDGTSATATGLATTSNAQAVRVSRAAARGGGAAYNVYRSFFEFDTSGVSVTPTDATLKIYGFFGSSADFFVVKADTATDGAIVAADFDAIVGWSSGADNSSNVTKYSSEVTSWSNSGYNDITLNAAALTSMVDDDVLKICCIESTKDLPNVELTSNFNAQSGMYYTEFTDTTRDPKIDFTEGVAGFGHKTIGVASANIGKISGVATANVGKVIGVD